MDEEVRNFLYVVRRLRHLSLYTTTEFVHHIEEHCLILFSFDRFIPPFCAEEHYWQCSSILIFIGKGAFAMFFGSEIVN